MTALKQEVINLVDTLPEDDMPRLIQFIHRLKVPINAETENTESESERNERIKEKKAALRRMEKYRKPVAEDFDYKKELAEAREEKYGSFD